MAKRYTYGNVTFESFLAKEHWILEMNIRSLEYLKDHGQLTRDKATLEHFRSTLGTMKKQERRIRKQLVKEGYFKS